MAGKVISKATLDTLDIDQLHSLQKDLMVRTVEVTVDHLEELREAHAAITKKIELAVSPYGLTARGFLASSREDVTEFLRDRVAHNTPGLEPGPAGGKRVRRASGRGIVAPKYRHPTKASLTWTGRGHQPDWVTKWLGVDKSRTLKQLRA